MTLEEMEIELGEIDPREVEDTWNHLFSKCDPEWVAQLASEYARDGYTGKPIIVERWTTLINGRHRTLAARQAGLENIPMIRLFADEVREVESQFGDCDDFEAAILARAGF
mgnify:CR=1 FL=1